MKCVYLGWNCYEFKNMSKNLTNIEDQPPFKNATKSLLSFELGIPAKAIEFPGAKSAGDLSHLSKLPSDHFNVAFACNADE